MYGRILTISLARMSDVYTFYPLRQKSALNSGYERSVGKILYYRAITQ